MNKSRRFLRMLRKNFKRKRAKTLASPEVTPVKGCILKCDLGVLLEHTGLYIGNGKIVSLEELEPILEKMYSENQNLALSLECERTVEFERIVQILTKIQNAGISRIGIVHDSIED